MNINFSGDVAEQAAQVISTMGSHGKMAVARSLNRTTQGVKTDSARVVRDRYSIKARVVTKTFSVDQRAKSNTLTASTKSTGSRAPLIAFGARPARPGGRKPTKGVSVKVRNSRKTIDGSFVARMKNGKLGIFRRSGEFGRNQDSHLERIQEIKTLAVPQAIKWQEGAQGKIASLAAARFEKRLGHEVGRVLEKMGAR